MSNLGGKALVVHEKEVDLSNIVHNQFLETVGKQMACLEFTFKECSYLKQLYHPYLLVAPVANLDALSSASQRTIT